MSPVRVDFELFRPVECAWEAARDDWDLGDPIGFGPTRQDAVEDLIQKELDRNPTQRG